MRRCSMTAFASGLVKVRSGMTKVFVSLRASCPASSVAVNASDTLAPAQTCSVRSRVAFAAGPLPRRGSDSGISGAP